MKQTKTCDTWLKMEELVNQYVRNYRADFFKTDYDIVFPLKDGAEFFYCVRESGTEIVKLGYTPDSMEVQAEYLSSIDKTWKIGTWYLIRKNVSITPMDYNQAIDYMNSRLRDVYEDTLARVKEYNDRMEKEGKYSNLITCKEAGITDTGCTDGRILI